MSDRCGEYWECFNYCIEVQGDEADDCDYRCGYASDICPNGDETGHPPAPSTVPHEDSGSDNERTLPGAHRVNRGVTGTVPERDED